MKVKDLLQKLLKIPSINPVFPAADPTWVGEARLTDLLQSWADEHGWKWLRQDVNPGRENLVALIPAQSGRMDSITLWEVHQDTVGVEGMRVDPFAGVEANGKIYGRGACDVKGSMAAMLTALATADTTQRDGPILLALSVNEECGFTGAKALASVWQNDSEFVQGTNNSSVRGTLTLDELRALRPHRAIVAEPTDFNVVVSHKGIIRWRCHTRGRAAHSSQPQRGHNAIYGMTEVVTAIREFDKQVLSGRGQDCLCGRPTVSVNTIHGGTGANVVPDHAVIDIDRRLMPGEVPSEAQQEVITYIAERISADTVIEHDVPWNQSRGMLPTSNQVWAEQVAGVARACGLSTSIVGVPYGTDAWVFASIGIPTVVFGPGSIAQAHTEDEWIAVDELERGVEAYRQLASQ